MRVFKTAINTRKDMHIVVFIKSVENPIKQIHLHLFLRIDDCDTSLSLPSLYVKLLDTRNRKQHKAGFRRQNHALITTKTKLSLTN